MRFLNSFVDYNSTLNEQVAPKSSQSGDMFYIEGGDKVWGNRKNKQTDFDPYEYKVKTVSYEANDQELNKEKPVMSNQVLHQRWIYRKRPHKQDPKNIPWTEFTDKVYCKVYPILDERFPDARNQQSKDRDYKMCKYATPPVEDTPKKEDEKTTKESIGTIPREWQPKSGVIYVPVAGKGMARSAGFFKANHPWRGLPDELVGKYDVKKGLHCVIITPNIGADFDDLLEFVEDGNLDFIRTNTIIIVTWETKYKVDVVNSDINDIKKYLGITKQVTGLPEQQQQQVQQKMNDEL